MANRVWMAVVSALAVPALVLVTACGAPAHPAVAATGVATAETGPGVVQVDELDWGVLGHRSWGEYVADMSSIKSITHLARPYAGASSAARYGVNIISGGHNVSWVLDGDPTTGYWLVVDADNDGDLANDQVWRLERIGELWRVEIAMRPQATGRAPPRAIIAFDGTDVRSYISVVRAGTIGVAGRAVKFTVTCQEGDCGDPRRVHVGFDLDGNGVVDPGQDAYEQYKASDRTVVVAGASYDFEIAADGSRLTLRPAKTAVAPRPTLALGSEAPGFEAGDPAALFSLAGARGRVVLLDFVSKGCHFCTVDLPWLRGVHDRYASAGLEVVTIAEGAPAFEAQGWPTVLEADPAPVGALYRVGAFPSYFVIDRRGKLVCSHCLHDDADRVLGEMFAPRRD